MRGHPTRNSMRSTRDTRRSYAESRWIFRETRVLTERHDALLSTSREVGCKCFHWSARFSPYSGSCALQRPTRVRSAPLMKSDSFLLDGCVSSRHLRNAPRWMIRGPTRSVLPYLEKNHQRVACYPCDVNVSRIINVRSYRYMRCWQCCLRVNFFMLNVTLRFLHCFSSFWIRVSKRNKIEDGQQLLAHRSH